MVLFRPVPISVEQLAIYERQASAAAKSSKTYSCLVFENAAGIGAGDLPAGQLRVWGKSADLREANTQSATIPFGPLANGVFR